MNAITITLSGICSGGNHLTFMARAGRTLAQARTLLQAGVEVVV